MDSSYTNSFGQFGSDAPSPNNGASVGASPIMSAPSGPVVSGEGDVVLAPSNGGGKKRRWPIVVAIVLFVVAIGAGVGAWIASQPWGSGGSGDNILRKYANYVINGDENNNDIGDGYVANRVYFIADQVYNAEETEFDLFYENANNLINVSLDVYKDDDVADFLVEQRNMLGVFYIYKKYDGKITMSDYLEGDYSLLVSEIDIVAESLKQSTNSYVIIYIEDILKLTELIAQLEQIYYNAGCSSKDIDELLACDIPAENVSGYIEKSAEIDKVRGEMSDMIKTLMTSYVKGVYEMLEVNND